VARFALEYSVVKERLGRGPCGCTRFGAYFWAEKPKTKPILFDIDFGKVFYIQTANWRSIIVVPVSTSDARLSGERPEPDNLAQGLD
jgi:hypothetical protein